VRASHLLAAAFMVTKWPFHLDEFGIRVGTVGEECSSRPVAHAAWWKVGRVECIDARSLYDVRHHSLPPSASHDFLWACSEHLVLVVYCVACHATATPDR
jgi:hypothetical protein